MVMVFHMIISSQLMGFKTVISAMIFAMKHGSKQHNLACGFEYFLFSPLFGEDSHFDSYFSDGLVQPPTRYWFGHWFISIRNSIKVSFRQFPRDRSGWVLFWIGKTVATDNLWSDYPVISGFVFRFVI